MPELDDESIREWFAYSYRIIYRIENETVTTAAALPRSEVGLAIRLAQSEEVAVRIR